MADVSMIFENDSGVVFNRGPTDWTGIIGSGENSLNQYPDATLAGNGTQVMAMSAFTGKAVPEYELWCSWIDPKTNIGFGVKIHVPVQLVGIGTAPYWEVSSGSPDELLNWSPSGDDPSQSYTWPASVGYKIYANSEATHSSLILTINISKLDT